MLPGTMFSRLPLPCLLLLLSLGLLGLAAGAEPFPEDSPEHQALVAASDFLGDEDFTLREEYWKGALGLRTGRALKLHFFKRNHYRLFLGVSPSALPKGAKLHLDIYDADNEVVASAEGEPDKASLVLALDDTAKTGLHLVLMRIEAPAGPLIDLEIPTALFYGWK